MVFIALLWIYAGIVFGFLAEKEINYIKYWLKTSTLLFLATFVIYLTAQTELSRHLPITGITAFAFFLLSILLIIIIYDFFRSFLNQDIVVKDQKQGIFTTSLSPYYAITKSFNVLLQQMLILVTVFILKDSGLSTATIIVVFSFIFGIAHIFHFLLQHRRDSRVIFLMIVSFLAGALFPVLLLYFPFGFVYTYGLHWIFLLTIGIFPHFLNKGKFRK